jgi:inner membrane protein
MTAMHDPAPSGRTPAAKFLWTLLIGALLAIPLFSVYLLVYDRQSQSETARASIAEGWGGPQTLAGPFLVIPYRDEATETVDVGGRPATRSVTVWRELVLAPDTVALTTRLRPERRQRAIYEAVLFEAEHQGRATFALPGELGRLGVAPERLALARAELRFGLSDARGLHGRPPQVRAGGRVLPLQPGKGPAETGGSGFFATLDAGALRSGRIETAFSFGFRGNGWLQLAPHAGDTGWTIASPWPHPSFQGGFLPAAREIGAGGFQARYRLGNLALGKTLAEVRDPGGGRGRPEPLAQPAGEGVARIALVEPADLYSRVNRAVKYGFLFIGFTFLALLMFDVIGGVSISAVEYLLVGAGLVLFFVLLLALAEVLGFAPAYVIASAAIIGEIGAYSAAVLRSARRAMLISGLLAALYATLYILLSLEAYSLLIGAGLLFVALGAVMYATRRVDWSGRSAARGS